MKSRVTILKLGGHHGWGDDVNWMGGKMKLNDPFFNDLSQDIMTPVLGKFIIDYRFLFN
jgi:hypothetical protein